MKERRTKEQIYYDIMSAIRTIGPKNCKDTHLARVSGLAFNKCKDHYKYMLLNKLVDSHYNITPKGQDFYHEFTNAIAQMYKVSTALGYYSIIPNAKQITVNQMAKLEECYNIMKEIVEIGQK